MKKSILKLGNVLGRTEQRSINGGLQRCNSTRDCPLNFTCIIIDQYFGGHCQDNDLPVAY